MTGAPHRGDTCFSLPHTLEMATMLSSLLRYVLLQEENVEQTGNYGGLGVEDEVLHLGLDN